MKILLILVDGMRPDALSGIPQAQTILQTAASTMTAQTVMPSVTLPCHMSLFHSVDPARHGTTTNTYAPQVRPVKGLCEVLAAKGKRSAFFYDWEELRDLTRPGSLDHACFYSGDRLGYDRTGDLLTAAAIEYLQSDAPDFAFLYFGAPDMAGHSHGWMSEQYRNALRHSFENIERVLAILPEDYTVILTADHGGHGRMHGTDLPEDMTIPMAVIGKDFEQGRDLGFANIKDIAPTVVKLLNVEPDDEWEGKSLL